MLASFSRICEATVFFRTPPFMNAWTCKKAVADQRPLRTAPKKVAARAEPQTLPRQKSSWLRKTARAMKPAK